jgi:hypothetical protein
VTKTTVGESGVTDTRSPTAIGLAWASRVTTISVQMVVLGLIGYWVDNKLEIRGLFTLLGFSLGMTFGTWQLIRFTRQSEQRVSQTGDGR